jgi:hypothetical protein
VSGLRVFQVWLVSIYSESETDACAYVIGMMSRGWVQGTKKASVCLSLRGLARVFYASIIGLNVLIKCLSSLFVIFDP